jgi:hypothetical protein
MAWEPALWIRLSEVEQGGLEWIPTVCLFKKALKVFSLLPRKKLIGLSLVQKILRWRHTGFNVHSKVRSASKKEAERVAKYMIRPLISLKRLFLDEPAGDVFYQNDKQGSQENSMDYLKFIARLTSHISDKG